MAPQDAEAKAWRKQVSFYYEALKNSKICSSVRHVKDFIK